MSYSEGALQKIYELLTLVRLGTKDKNDAYIHIRGNETTYVSKGNSSTNSNEIRNRIHQGNENAE